MHLDVHVVNYVSATRLHDRHMDHVNVSQ